MKHVVAQAQALGEVLESLGDEPLSQELRASGIDCVTQLIENSDYVEALRLMDHLDRATGVQAPADSEILRAHVLRAWALLRLRRTAEASDWLQQAVEANSSMAPRYPQVWAEILSLQASCLWRTNRPHEAVEQLLVIRAELLKHPDGVAACRCALELSAAYQLVGDRSAARMLALEALVLARRINLRYWQAGAALELARIHTIGCDWRAASEAVNDALLALGERQSPHHRRILTRRKGIIEWKRGAIVDAMATVSAHLDETRETEMFVDYWYAAMLRALILTHMGRFAEAEKALNEEPDWKIPSKFSRGSLLTAEYLADLDLEQGKAAPALARYTAALTQALALVPRGDIVAELRRRIAECHLLLGEPAKALDQANESLALCREIHERYDEAAVHRVIGLAHAALGCHGEAKKSFDDGFALYDEIETPYEWGKLWMSYGDWLAAETSGGYRNPSAAREAYGAAIDHFERMGAEFRLGEARQRLEALTARMQYDLEDYVPTSGKVRPARRPRHAAETLRRAQWALEMFGIVTRSAPLLAMLEEISSVAASDLPVLILGESGTGKELVAKGVHALSGRTGEFVAVNCSAVPESMLEGEFFGFMKGAFTNAVADKPGLFEVAHDGSVFLDEIGEMSPDLQAKLLRFLETGSVRRVGATRDQLVDTRIVAATNRQRSALQSGQGFRSDLYYRLAHAVYELPPLRERGDDVELLVEHFLAAFNLAEGKRTTLGASARKRLVQHPWPGNVRQLQAVIHKLVVAAKSDTVLTPRDLPPLDEDPGAATFAGEIQADEKRRILRALEQANFVKTDAAAILRISRTTLLGKMKRYGVEA